MVKMNMKMKQKRIYNRATHKSIEEQILSSVFQDPCGVTGYSITGSIFPYDHQATKVLNSKIIANSGY